MERLDRVLRLVPRVLGIADDIVIHDAVLCETARLNNLSLNSKKMQFKSTDCKFFGTDPRWNKSGPQENRGHHTHGTTTKCCVSTVFQWHGELFEV